MGEEAERTESMIDDVDLTTITEVESCGDTRRDKVREFLFKALCPRRLEEEREPAIVAVKIENECFTALKDKEYNSQIRSIKFNLSDPKNPNFKSKVLLGFFKDEQFPKLSSEDMASDEKNREREVTRKRTLEECQSDWGVRHGAIQESGMFQCGKCKGSRTTYFQMQTRSADEPMTTFVTCLNCKNKWKFC
jgi:transcription elongation factor S-II